MKRRTLLSLITGSLIGVSPLTEIAAYPISIYEQAREETLLSYEEWKAYETKPEYPRTEKDIEVCIKTDQAVKTKVLRMIENGQRTFFLLTKKEKESLESEFHLFEPGDIADFNAKYNLRFSYEQFKRNSGAQVLWWLDREYSYKYTEEKQKAKTKK